MTTEAKAIIYTGEWFAGLPQGKGEMHYPDGGLYEGFFVEGMKHGRGKYTFADKAVYQG